MLAVVLFTVLLVSLFVVIKSGISAYQACRDWETGERH